MIKRHYKFHIHIFQEVGGKTISKMYGGVIYHSSLFPNPGVAWINAMQFAKEQFLQRHWPEPPEKFENEGMEMLSFERIK